MNSVQTKVAEQIAAISPKVEDSVVEVLVKRELDKRSTALVQVFDALAQLELEMKKTNKPDMIFTAGGEKIEGQTQKRVKEIEELQKKIDKYNNAITKALDKGDFGDVYNLKNNKPGGSGDKPEADTASD